MSVLDVAREARGASNRAELFFVIVNTPFRLLSMRQALVLDADGRLTAASGVSTVERDGAFAYWLRRWFASSTTGGPEVINCAAASIEDRRQWAEWLPEWLVVEPLAEPDGNVDFVWLIGFEEKPSAAELALIAELSDCFRHALWAIQRRKARVSPKLSRWLRPSRLLLIALCAAMFAPVTSSVLIEAEIVSIAPAVVRSPLDGVVSALLVQSSEVVDAGAGLLQLDRTASVGRRDVARKELEIAEAAHALAVQRAFADPNAKAEVALLRGRIDERRAELALIESQLARSEIAAPRGGVVLIDDPMRWIGRTVQIGEAIMAIADPNDVEIEGWLTSGDMIAFESDARVTMFLDGDPLRPIAAEMTYLAYRAERRPDGSWGYRMRARILDGEEPPRLGLRGVARVESGRAPLAYLIMRRPLARLRSWLGW